MRIKYALILLVLLMLLNCANKSDKPVSWSPVEPQIGDIIKVTYHPQTENANLVDASQITIVCQFYVEDADSVLIASMNKTNNDWQIKLDPPDRTLILSIKFEDDLNRTDDNFGRGWQIILKNNENNIAKNTHYYLGQIFRGKNRPEALPYYKKAIVEFEREIEAYPSNYKAWFDKWEAEINLTKDIVPVIEKKLDSLLAIDPQHVELLKLAFNTNWKILRNKDEAIYFAERLMTVTPQPESIDFIAYALIFLKHSTNLKKQMEAIEKFIKDYPESNLLERLYFHLANYYLRTKNNEKAKSIFDRLNKLVPDDIDNKLTLCSMEINDQNYKRAMQLLDEAKSFCTIEFLTTQNPWQHPGKRRNQMNFNLCQIYSTTAKLNSTLGNIEKAIENRKTVIELGTPFPAFEWEEIGKSYLELNKFEQAEKAFIKALSINPDQKKSIQNLKKLYVNKQNKADGFDEYLERAIKAELKASATLAPDFEALDLNDNKFRLSDMRGKIIVLNFWDSWSETCVREIPQLNELVADFEDFNFVEFWAISGDYKSSINRFLQDHKFDYHQFYNGNNIRKLYQIIGLPTHLLIDSQGYIRYQYVGFTPNIKQRLQQNIQFLLQESKIIS